MQWKLQYLPLKCIKQYKVEIPLVKNKYLKTVLNLIVDLGSSLTYLHKHLTLFLSPPYLVTFPNFMILLLINMILNVAEVQYREIRELSCRPRLNTTDFHMFFICDWCLSLTFYINSPKPLNFCSWSFGWFTGSRFILLFHWFLFFSQWIIYSIKRHWTVENACHSLPKCLVLTPIFQRFTANSHIWKAWTMFWILFDC